LTWTPKSDSKPIKSEIRSLKFAFDVSFHNLKSNFDILVLKIVLPKIQDIDIRFMKIDLKANFQV